MQYMTSEHPALAEVPVTKPVAFGELAHSAKLLSLRPTSAVYLCQLQPEDSTHASSVVIKHFVLSDEETTCQSAAEVADNLSSAWQELETARVLQKIGGHRHVIQFLDQRETETEALLTMEVCAQGDLYAFLERQPSMCLPEKTALQVFAQILEGVAFLHRHGIAHRDLSLENVLLDDKFQAKICDFGLSTFVPANEPDFTCVGRVGKPYYMAPEVVANAAYHPFLADVWSLGVMLFILLTGSPLFEVASPSDASFDALRRVGVQGILRSWGIEHTISHGTLELLIAMLDVSPRHRAQSVEELHEATLELLQTL